MQIYDELSSSLGRESFLLNKFDFDEITQCTDLLKGYLLEGHGSIPSRKDSCHASPFCHPAKQKARDGLKLSGIYKITHFLFRKLFFKSG